MRLIAYSEVLAGVCDAMGWARQSDGTPNLDAEEWHGAKRAISRALAKIYDDDFWPELCRIERRRFHPVYDDSEIVTAGTVRFFPPTGLYYQALRDNAVNNAPATKTSSGNWDTNLAYWAESLRAIPAQTFDSTKTYAVGDTVIYVPNGLTYQVHTAAVAGTVPTDTTVWGQITALDPRVPWEQTDLLPMGRIRAVYLDNPATYRGARRVLYTETVNGVQIRDPLVNEVWVHYQLRAPKFQGGTFDASTTYIPEGTAVNYSMRWGTSLSTTLTESAVLALTSSTLTPYVTGTRSFAAGGYKYVAYQDTLGSPAAGTGFMDQTTGFPVAMAGTADGYTSVENGWYYLPLTVSGTAWRVYRTLNTLGDVMSITIT